MKRYYVTMKRVTAYIQNSIDTYTSNTMIFVFRDINQNEADAAYSYNSSPTLSCLITQAFLCPFYEDGAPKINTLELL